MINALANTRLGAARAPPITKNCWGSAIDSPGTRSTPLFEWPCGHKMSLPSEDVRRTLQEILAPDGRVDVPGSAGSRQLHDLRILGQATSLAISASTVRELHRAGPAGHI